MMRTAAFELKFRSAEPLVALDKLWVLRGGPVMLREAEPRRVQSVPLCSPPG